MKYRTLAESIISDKSVNSAVKIATQEAVKESAQKFLNAHSLNGGNLKQQELLRSESDKFDYKLIQLDNGIRVLLISDPSYKDLASVTTPSSSQENVNSTGNSDVEMSDHSDAESVASSASSSSASSKKGNDKQAAIAIGVHAGGFQDPNDFPGMAHMLEHMISMGSEAYPLENALDDFLSSRGGYQNAHTEVEYTMYEIKVHRNHFKKAIEMIGKAFVAPLLRATSIDREIKPVDTEFVQACNYDDVRAQLVLNENANQKHPISKFMWGNRKSLITEPTAKGLDIRQSLLDFFNKYYYPENIVVVVQSQEPLANLEEWTMVFADVKARSPTASTPTAEALNISTIAPFDNAKFNRFYIMEAISSGTQLQVNWVLPPVLDKYLSSAFDYLCALLGHEGKGSLIAELRKRDLAIDLVTESEYFCPRNNSLLSIFGMEIHLTESGALRLEEVVQLIFEYITVIRSAGAQEYFYRENQTIAHKSFNNKSERSPLAYVVDLATNMMHYPVEHTLSGHSLYYHYDKAAIDDLLAHFLPHNVNLIHIGGKFKPELPTLTEKWMGTKYQEMAIPAAWIEKANQCHSESAYFHYPKPNAFIATKFDLLRDTLPPGAPDRRVGEYPTTVLKASERLTIWHKPDFKFNLPKGCIVLHLLNPCIDGSLQGLALADVFFEYVMYLLKEDTYDALAADLNWNLSQTYNGIQIFITGFNHKLTDLVILILNRLKTIEFDPTILESMKTEVTKNYNNNYQDQDTFNQNLRLFLLVDRFYTYLDRWPLIAAIDKAQMETYKAKVLSNLSVEVLVHGNISIEETTHLGKRIDELLKLSSTSSTETPYAKVKTLVRQLPVGVSRIRALTLSEKNSMSQVVCYYQLKPYDIESTIYLSLFISIIDELCFDTLRTKEGLGYRVCCGENDTFGILGFNVCVASQAAKFQCSFIEERINAFVDTRCREYIDTLSQAKFEEFVSSALKRRQAPDVSLGDEVKRNVDEICSFDYCFDRLKREIAQLKQITLEGFRKWTGKHIFVPANERRQLTIQIVGNGEVSLAECTTVDGLPVSESMIPRESSQGRCKPLLLLHAKEQKDGFIDNAEAFRKQLPMFPLQPSLKDLK